MSRPLIVSEENTDPDLITTYIEEQSKLEREAQASQDVYKGHVGLLEKHRKRAQAKGLNTEAIDEVRRLKRTKNAKQRAFYLSTFDAAREILQLDEQVEMFPVGSQAGDAEALRHATA